MSTALAQRQRLHEIHRRITELKGRAALVLYELGTLLLEVDEQSLWTADGHASFDVWLAEALDVSRATAWKAMRVAKHFNAPMVERYGVEKLNAGLRYLELTGAQERPGDLVAADLRLRGDDGRYFSVPFNNASYRQVVEASRLLEETRARRGGIPREAEDWADRVNQTLAASGGKLKLRRRRDGKVLVSLSAIPLDELAAFAAAVLARAGEP